MRVQHNQSLCTTTVTPGLTLLRETEMNVSDARQECSLLEVQTASTIGSEGRVEGSLSIYLSIHSFLLSPFQTAYIIGSEGRVEEDPMYPSTH